MSRNSSSFAESLVELIKEQVESVIDDYDISDKVKDEMPDVEDMVEKAVDELDIDGKVTDAVENFDFSDLVEKEVEKELTANLHEYVENDFDSFTKGDKFKELVLAEVNRVLEARDAAAKLVADAKRAKLVDYVKFGPLRRWLGNWGSWY